MLQPSKLLLVAKYMPGKIEYFILIYITTTTGAKNVPLGARVKVGVSLDPSWCPGTEKHRNAMKFPDLISVGGKNRNLEDLTICAPLGCFFETSLLNRSC